MIYAGCKMFAATSFERYLDTLVNVGIYVFRANGELELTCS